MNEQDEEEFRNLVSKVIDDQVGLDSARFSIFENHGIRKVRYTSTNLPKIMSDESKLRSINEWREVGLDLIEKLDFNNFGEYQLDTISEGHVQIEEVKID